MNTADLFVCRQCGQCCRGYGGTVVTRADIHRIAEYLGTRTAEFTARCCTSFGSRTMLRQADSGFCLFYDAGCTIHPVKPAMCRNWPFIQGVLRDPQNWRIMARFCPGMRPDAPLDDVLACVQQVLKVDVHGESAATPLQEAGEKADAPGSGGSETPADTMESGCSGKQADAGGQMNQP